MPTVPASCVPHTFHAARCFAPSYSLLGRWLRHRTGDARRAEAHLIVVLTLLGIGVLLFPALAGSLGSGLGGGAYTLTGGAVLGLVLLGSAVLLGGVVGFKPALRVTCTPTVLQLRQGARTLTCSYADITHLAWISAVALHRHYGRYAGTQLFTGRVKTERRLLLLHTTEGPVVVGLPPDDLVTLFALLDDRCARRPRPCAAHTV